MYYSNLVVRRVILLYNVFCSFFLHFLHNNFLLSGTPALLSLTDGVDDVLLAMAGSLGRSWYVGGPMHAPLAPTLGIVS
jgi:hypothetical protein